MSLRCYLDNVILIKARPSLVERLERWIAAAHHKLVVRRLRRLRFQLEREAAPQPWTEVQAPWVVMLKDVCDALSMNDGERAAVLGREGAQALAEILETRPVPSPRKLLNARQAKALAHVREHGEINLSAYRQLCPGLSDETLRLDLADLVRRGRLKKNGAKRGTYYTRVLGREVMSADLGTRKR
jgi:hypothetical protein